MALSSLGRGGALPTATPDPGSLKCLGVGGGEDLGVSLGLAWPSGPHASACW